MAEQNQPNTNITDFERNALQHIVHTIQQYRILLAGRIHGLEEYQALLDTVEDISEEVIRLGELPASEAARALVDLLFDELFDMMQIFIELLN
ncbi:hypothetical protein GCK72_025207 [Caenorhabditis remanei]|nr:hypothetical protein GCK72_025207 [Caenorhabditis remanei]KAF1748740.1 hypothetical protein GCK72_025207 [Caenorhabditis remanei]